MSLTGREPEMGGRKMTTLVEQTIVKTSVESVIDKLNVIEKRKHLEQGFTIPADLWHFKEKRRYLNLDCGHSGAFLVDKFTGEIYNIKAYGVADQNKKIKADLGNINTVDVEKLHCKRWNYLR